MKFLVTLLFLTFAIAFAANCPKPTFSAVLPTFVSQGISTTLFSTVKIYGSNFDYMTNELTSVKLISSDAEYDCRYISIVSTSGYIKADCRFGNDFKLSSKGSLEVTYSANGCRTEKQIVAATLTGILPYCAPNSFPAIIHTTTIYKDELSIVSVELPGPFTYSAGQRLSIGNLYCDKLSGSDTMLRFKCDGSSWFSPGTYNPVFSHGDYGSCLKANYTLTNTKFRLSSVRCAGANLLGIGIPRTGIAPLFGIKVGATLLIEFQYDNLIKFNTGRIYLEVPDSDISITVKSVDTDENSVSADVKVPALTKPGYYNIISIAYYISGTCSNASEKTVLNKAIYVYS